MKEIEKFKEYLVYQRNASPNTLYNYLLDLKQFFNNVKKQPKDVTTHDLIQYINNIRKNGMSASSTNRKISSLKTFFNFLVKQNYIQNNPASTLETIKQERKLPYVPNTQEVFKLINIADNKRDKIVLDLLYSCGVRRSEVIKLEIKDINFEEGFIKIKGKGNKERYVPIHENALNAIKEYIKEENITRWLFPSKHDKTKHISARAINDIVTKWSSKIGIKVTPHKLRHAFCTDLYNNGADLRLIQELAGHANLNTTQIYTHINNSKKKNDYLKYHPRAREI